MNHDIMHSIELGKEQGFDLKVNFLVEYSTLDQAFDSSCENLEELAKKIDSYDLVFFTAQLVASKKGIELGSDYLGCCLYDSYDNFISDACTLSDMKNEAISNAVNTLKELAA